MNNYCTNCGTKLEKNELVCKNCNIPIVDLPYNYKYKSPERRKKIKRNLIIISVCTLFIVAFIFSKNIIKKIKVNKLQREYVEPYLKENYASLNYSVKYVSSGQCIISGECSSNLFSGCEGGYCEEYEYLDKKDCKSYYYSVKTDTESFKITVFNKDNKFTVVKGVNIYGDYQNTIDDYGINNNDNNIYND
ncbi:MAG: hypothetical protein PUD59_04775 [bacterium]|nr:hypothetical protein [bacterium]